jgi:hypothetical protein
MGKAAEVCFPKREIGLFDVIPLRIRFGEWLVCHSHKLTFKSCICTPQEDVN